MVSFFLEHWRSNTSEYMLIKEEINKVLSKNKAAGVLRLVFHDAGTFEMNENSGTYLWIWEKKHWFNDFVYHFKCICCDFPYSL